MNKIRYWSLAAAMAGFLFGFDTVVISGADQQLQALWNSSDLFHGMVVVAMALWGTVLGALFGGIPTQKIGRKQTLLFIGVLYSLSALGSALATGPWMFAFFRFIGGVGVGASTIAVPAYISEVAPAKNRGRFVGFYQFNIVFGILVAFVSNYLLSGLGEQAWRWMMGVEALPAILYTGLVLGIPKSPRWLYLQGDKKAAQRILESAYGAGAAEQIMADIAADQQASPPTEQLFAKKYRRILMLTFFIAFFNQFSGINAFLYYAPRIFEEGGLGASSALLSSIGIGVINLVFTLVGINLIDRLGRRVLMYIGSVGYIVSLSLIAASFVLHWEGLALPMFLFGFIASHAIGQGAVIWVYISEIYPNHLRSAGQSFGTSTHWVLAALIPSMVPLLFGWVGPGMVFAFFALMMIFQLLFVHYLMPETKGVSLEALSSKLSLSSDS